jgi:hypothetical protein
MIDASVCDIAARSWNLIYDSRNWDCSHGSGKACLVQGEKIEELTPGNELELEVSREWTSMKLYRSYGNELGQVACLLSLVYGEKRHGKDGSLSSLLSFLLPGERSRLSH